MKPSDFKRVTKLDMPSRPPALYRPNISEYLTFLTLKHLFGLPDKEPDDQHWKYYFKTSGGYISIGSWHNPVEIIGGLLIYPENAAQGRNIDKCVDDINAFLTRESKQHIKEARRKIAESDFKILQNPFAIYLADAKLLLDSAERGSNP